VILADENLPASIIAALESAGFAVVQIADLDAGAGDDAVLRYAVQRGLIVVTQDKDFGDLVYQQGHRHAGVVLVRLRGMPFADKARRVIEVFEEHGERLHHVFVVVANSGVRIRE